MRRIYFILSGENLFHPYYFSNILKKLNRKKYSVVGVTIPEERYKDGFVNFLKQQISLWGLTGFVFIGAMSKVRILLESLGVNGLSVQNIAKMHKISTLSVRSVNSGEHLDYLRRKKVDIIISSNGQIFKKDLLNLPKVACINRHSALLPKYGGVLPVFWAMFYKEKKFGVSIHYMKERIDTGDILSQDVIPLNKTSSMFENYITAFTVGVDTTLQGLENLQNKKSIPYKNPREKAYFSFPTTHEIKRFKRQRNTFKLNDIIAYRKIFR